MDKNSIIDLNNFEVYTFAEDYPNIIVCDRRIAPSVAILNKKGYITSASCEGHYLEGCNEQFNVDLEFLSEAQNDSHYFIREIRDDSFDCYSEYLASTIYILFKDKWEFSTLPDGFEIIHYDQDDRMLYNGTSLEHHIEFFDDKNHKRPRKEIEEEIEKYCKILEKWAKDLPDIK